jgi:hypothetical protein
MVKVEFTGSVEEVKKEIREFIEANCTEVIISTQKAIGEALDNAKSKTEEKKESIKKVEDAPTQKLPIAPAKEEAPVAVATPLPTKTAEYTANDLQTIAATWVEKDAVNNRKAMRELLAKFGVKAITVLPQESYGAFVQELKNLGVDI